MLRLLLPLALLASADPQREADLRAPKSAALLSDKSAESSLAMGRVQSPDYIDALAARLRGKQPAAALFALGQMGLAEGVEAKTLERAAASVRGLLDVPLPSLRALAVEALGKTGSAADEAPLVKALSDKDAGVREEAAIALFRLRMLKRVAAYSDAAAAAPIARFGDAAPSVRWRAVYAFSRHPQASARAELEKALSDQEPLARLFAARALGLLGKDQLGDALIRAQNDPDFAVRAEVVKALGGAGLSDSALADPSVHVRTAAAETLADPARLAKLVEDGSVMVRAAASAAYKRLGHPGAAKREAEDKKDARWWVRSHAYKTWPDAAGVSDPDPRVASAALEALPADKGLILTALASAELETAGTAVELAKKHPSADYLPALRKLRESRYQELADEAEAAYALIVSTLSLKEAPWEKIERPRRPSPWLGKKLKPTSVVMETEKGELELQLAVKDAPIHAAAFAQSVSSGLYDGSTWHRVVTNFVVQGGDPRGSGWGDAGFSLRDEISRLRFERGALGMPKAAKDTGGCQLFVTHVPTPHLDGRYTVFGRVTRGMDVVDRLEPGDKILKARLKEVK